MAANGDTDRTIDIDGDTVVGLGSYHKTLPHNEYGEVEREAFGKLVAATRGDGSGFREVPKGSDCPAELTNPQAGLARDRLTRDPASYRMPPAPKFDSRTTAAEITELYWMASLRDVSFHEFSTDAGVGDAASELQTQFREAIDDSSDPGRLKAGVDVPGALGATPNITPQNVFRLGLPGEEFGPFVSQFFVRPVQYGTQAIDQKQVPYAANRNYLTKFDDWLRAQNSGRDDTGRAYPKSNEGSRQNFECPESAEMKSEAVAADEMPCTKRYIATMRDLARFVNKDALHQAYFNATLILLSGGAKWTPGNPYASGGRLESREAGFGVLGGPHILALVSEVATRALKIVWNQKWQVNLRLRPEAYAGLIHVQQIGVGPQTKKRAYGLPESAWDTNASRRIREATGGGYLLPMAFTAGSPTHPSYGAGHATVAGACVTVLKAYFKTFNTVGGVDEPIKFTTLRERAVPYGDGTKISTWVTGPDLKDPASGGPPEGRAPLCTAEASKLTIEGELNKLATNVAMGRAMGGVHWRTDNTRSLVLGEAIAAQILADITVDAAEQPEFVFRTFTRRSDGNPKKVVIRRGRIFVDGVQVDTNSSEL